MQTEQRLRIYRRNGTWVVDVGERTVPAMHSLSPYLPREVRERYSTVQSALGSGVSPQLLSDALKAFYTTHPNQLNTTTGEQTIGIPEGISELGATTAYLAAGDTIYRVVPVAHAGASKALRLLREKGRREVEQERARVLAQVQAEATSIRERADLYAVAARAAAMSDAAAFKVPAWYRGPLIAAPSQLSVAFSFLFHVTRFTHGPLSWPAVEAPLFSVTAYVPILKREGAVGQPQECFLSQPPYLPHIGDRYACVTLGEPPVQLTSMESLTKFGSQLARAFSVINLASLLTADWDKWDVRAKAFVPPVIATWLNANRERNRQEVALDPLSPLARAAQTETVLDTWSVRR